ncbi:MAG TPA: phosphoribosyltransferase [Burkholderiaceae bacterium]
MVADFKDRADAGRQLAAAVVRLGLVDPLVLALPRGGVPVAAEVARALRAPLDLLIVRKIGAPGHPELAVAAIAEGDPPTVVIDESTSQVTEGDHAYIKREVRTQRAEIKRRCKTYRHGRARLGVAGKTVVVVDDGIATGTTVRAALKALRRMRPAKVVLAVPVASNNTIYELSKLVDDVVCLSEPGHFGSVGTYYADFHQVGDDEVIALLDASRRAHEHEPAARALQSGEPPLVWPSRSDLSEDPTEPL